jgi:hypothetical protein
MPPKIFNKKEIFPSKNLKKQSGVKNALFYAEILCKELPDLKIYTCKGKFTHTKKI